MKKLKLDTLRVQSFSTAPAPARARGTVQARAAETDPMECPAFNAVSEYDTDCSYANCTYGCTEATVCFMATLPPKCV